MNKNKISRSSLDFTLDDTFDIIHILISSSFSTLRKKKWHFSVAPITKLVPKTNTNNISKIIWGGAFKPIAFKRTFFKICTTM